MKYFICIVSIIVLFSCRNEEKAFVKAPVIPSKIDSLKTAMEIEDFIRTLDSNYYENFKLQKAIDFEKNFRHDSLVMEFVRRKGIKKSFFKEDFDNNGYNDLLVTGDSNYGGGYVSFKSFVVMNFAHDSVQIHDIIRARNTFSSPDIIYKKKKPLIRVIECEDYDWDGLPGEIQCNKIRENILSYGFGNFIELNDNPVDINIEKIVYSTGSCHGSCPVFQLTINKDRSAYFIARYYNFSDSPDVHSNLPIEELIEEEGVFKTTLMKADYQKVVDLINYIDINNLDDYYIVNALGPQDSTLIISYDGGKVKKIIDHGKSGTYGLKILYNLLFDLRFNQNWKPAEEPEGVRLPENKKITMDDI